MLPFQVSPRTNECAPLVFHTHYLCVLCVCVLCHPIYSGRQTTPFGIICGRTSRGVIQEGHTGGFSPPFFLRLPSEVLALFFFREKDSAVPFPRRPRSRILCTHDIIVLHLLGMMREKIPVRVTAPRFELTSQRQKVSRLRTEPPGRPGHV